jgi:predicted nucleotidyltransferase
MEANPIIEELRACLPAILEDRPVLLAYAYGSQVAGYATPKSDVDIALVLHGSSDLSPYERMELALDVELAIEAQCEVPTPDVRSIDQAPLRIQGDVVTHGVLLYSADEDARVEYEIGIRTRYFDFQPVLERMRNAYFASLERTEETS